MSISSFLLIYVALLNLLMGFFTFFKGEKGKAKYFYGLIVIVGGVIWTISILFFRLSSSSGSIMFWGKIAHIAAVGIAVFLAFFAIYFPYLRIKRIKRLAFLIIIPALFLIFILYSSDLIVGGGFKKINGENFYNLGSLYISYALFIVFFFFIAFIELAIKFFESRSITAKAQIGYVFLGLSISSTVGVITNLILPGFSIIKYNWIGPFGTIFMIGFFTYAILKHHLMNIKVVATEFLVAILASTLFTEIFFEKQPGLIFFRISIFIVVSIFGLLLIKSVLREVKAKEKIQNLAKDLEAANVELKKLDKAKSEFLSIASHQLRTPLTAIKGYSSMILEGAFGKFSEGVKDATGKILESSRQLVLMIDDFLDISKIEAGKMSYEFSTFNLDDLIKKMVKGFLDNNKKARELNLKYITSNQDFPIRGDINKISQVVSNLLDNAVKYTPTGYINVHLDKNQKGDAAILTVKDTGIGISKETMAKLFQKFSRSEKSSLFNTSGSGLGLYVAKRIITDHKGRIWVESDGPGKGSSFFVELPLG